MIQITNNVAFSTLSSHILQTPPLVPLFLRGRRPAPTLWTQRSSPWSPFRSFHPSIPPPRGTLFVKNGAVWGSERRKGCRLRPLGRLGAVKGCHLERNGVTLSHLGPPFSHFGCLWASFWNTCGCQNQAKNDCHASNVLVIGGRPKAAQEYWSSGRPKAASIG